MDTSDTLSLNPTWNLTLPEAAEQIPWPQCGLGCLIPKGLRWRSCCFNPNFKRKVLRDYFTSANSHIHMGIEQDKALTQAILLGPFHLASHSSGHSDHPMATPLPVAPGTSSNFRIPAAHWIPTPKTQKPWEAPASLKKSFSYTSKNLKTNGV